MEDMNTGTSPVTEYRISADLVHLGSQRKVQRQALEDVTDQLRRVCVGASLQGLSDAHIARTAQVSITTLRVWLGKGNNG